METLITEILKSHRDDPQALERKLVPAVYDALRRMAADRVRREGRTISIQPTELVNEAYLRLFDGKSDWENRRHFFGAAAEAMRRILIERARKRGRIKHGGGMTRIAIDPDGLAVASSYGELLDLHRSLSRFEAIEPRKALVVKLRYFLGLTLRDTAEVLGICVATVKLDWSFAKAWLWRDLTRLRVEDADAS